MSETTEIESFTELQNAMFKMSSLEVRAMFDAMSAESEIAPEPMADVKDIFIPSPDGPIPSRVFTPENNSLGVPRPILLWFHGGGMVIGAKYVQSDRAARRVANRTGCTILAVDFRLGPEYKYPAGILDSLVALRWAASHGGEIGGDPTRLAVLGDSGGGLPAAICAVVARDEGLNLRHQVLIYPQLDCTMSESTWDTNAKFGMTRKIGGWFLDLYLPEGIDRLDPMVSPVFTPDLKGVASATIVAPEHDPLIGESRTYTARLKAAGVPTELNEWPGVPHSFFAMPVQYHQAVHEAADYVAQRLKEALA